jgi:hypothetical protein
MPPAVTAAAIAQASSIPAQQAAQTHCLAVAKQRAEDAAANGLDGPTQKVVRDGSYTDCMNWQAAHP